MRSSNFLEICSLPWKRVLSYTLRSLLVEHLFVMTLKSSTKRSNVEAMSRACCSVSVKRDTHLIAPFSSTCTVVTPNVVEHLNPHHPLQRVVESKHSFKSNALAIAACYRRSSMYPRCPLNPVRRVVKIRRWQSSSGSYDACYWTA